MSEVKVDELEVVAWVLLNEKGRTEEILPYAPTASDVQSYWPEPIQLCRHSEALAGYAARDVRIAELEADAKFTRSLLSEVSKKGIQLRAELAAAKETIMRYETTAENCDLLRSAPSAVVMPAVSDGYAIMPTALTAENGAKAAMLGEFSIDLQQHCPECSHEDGDIDCELCGGDVEYTETVMIDWKTIKEIYAKAVDLLAASPAAKGGDV